MASKNIVLKVLGITPENPPVTVVELRLQRNTDGTVTVTDSNSMSIITVKPDGTFFRHKNADGRSFCLREQNKWVCGDSEGRIIESSHL